MEAQRWRRGLGALILDKEICIFPLIVVLLTLRFKNKKRGGLHNVTHLYDLR